MGNAYDRTTYVNQRRKMMCLWADYLDQLRAGTDVVTMLPSAMLARVSSPNVDRGNLLALVSQFTGYGQPGFAIDGLLSRVQLLR